MKLKTRLLRRLEAIIFDPNLQLCQLLQDARIQEECQTFLNDLCFRYPQHFTQVMRITFERDVPNNTIGFKFSPGLEELLDKTHKQLQQPS